MPLLLAICTFTFGVLMSKYQPDLAKTHFQFSIESDWFLVSAEEVKVKKNTEKNHGVSWQNIFHFVKCSICNRLPMNILTHTHNIRTSSFSVTQWPVSVDILVSCLLTC